MASFGHFPSFSYHFHILYNFIHHSPRFSTFFLPDSLHFNGDIRSSSRQALAKWSSRRWHLIRRWRRIVLEPGSPGKNLRFHEFHLIYIYTYIYIIMYVYMYIYMCTYIYRYEIDIACIWNVLNIRHFGGIVVLGFDGSNECFIS